MTALAHAPAPAHPPDAPGRRVRRLAGPALAALLLAGTGYLVAQAVHEPLEQGSGVLAFGVADDAFQVVPQQTLTNAFGSDFRVVTPAVGARVGIAFGLRNSGRTPVEVLSVGSPLPPAYLGAPIAFTSEHRSGSGAPYRALRPFTLPAGGGRDVGVTLRVTGCPDGPGARNAGTLVVDRVPVTWRWLGRTHVTDVPLVFRGSLAGLPVCAP